MTKSGVQARVWPVLFALSIAGYPLFSFLPELLGVDNRAISVPFRFGMLLLSVLLVVVSMGNSNQRYRGLLWLPFIVFWFLYVVRLVISVFDPPERLDRPLGELVLYAIGICLVTATAFFARVDVTVLKRAFRMTVTVAAMAAIAAVLTNLSRLGTSFGRSFGNEYMNPISLGHLGVSLMLLSALMILHTKRIAMIVSSLGLIFVGLLCVVLSSSRAPVLAFAVGLLAMAVHAYAQKRKLRVTVFLVLLAIALPTVAERSEEVGSSVVTRVVTSALGQRRELRATRFADAWKQFLEAPWIGSSVVETRSGTYPHNLVIESFMATGVVGGIAYSALVIASLVASAKLLVRNLHVAWLGILGIQYFVAASFSGALFTHSSMWALLTASITAASMSNHASEIRGFAPQGPRETSRGSIVSAEA